MFQNKREVVTDIHINRQASRQQFGLVTKGGKIQHIALREIHE